MRIWEIAIPAALMLAASGWASTAKDVAASVQEIRAQGCDGHPGTSLPLRLNPVLDRVAAALATGERLEQAMTDAGYRAQVSAVLEVSGNQATFGKLLAARGCDDILDPAYRELGSAERPGKAWIVMAAPIAPPPAADAAAIGREVLALTNEARTSARRCGWKRFDAVAPLAASATLERAARSQAWDMAERGVLSHAGRDGSQPGDRVTRAGYTWTVGSGSASRACASSTSRPGAGKIGRAHV